MWLQNVWETALFSGTFAGLLAVLITLAIESFGGLVRELLKYRRCKLTCSNSMEVLLAVYLEPLSLPR